VTRGVGIGFAEPHHVTFDVLLGRSAAFCLHPFLAWRRLPATGRVLLVGAYFGGSYVAVLAALLIG
jgi:hypothetical protein